MYALGSGVRVFITTYSDSGLYSPISYNISRSASCSVPVLRGEHRVVLLDNHLLRRLKLPTPFFEKSLQETPHSESVVDVWVIGGAGLLRRYWTYALGSESADVCQRISAVLTSLRRLTGLPTACHTVKMIGLWRNLGATFLHNHLPHGLKLPTPFFPQIPSLHFGSVVVVLVMGGAGVRRGYRTSALWMRRVDVLPVTIGRFYRLRCGQTNRCILLREVSSSEKRG